MQGCLFVYFFDYSLIIYEYIYIYIYGWFGFLTEDNKFSINYLIDTTRLYKQKTSAATRPSQGFEILVLASFRSHYSGVLITYGTATRNCSTEFTFVTELNSFQPVPNDTISDWRTNNVSKIVLPRFLTLKRVARLTPQESEWSKGPREVNWWTWSNFGNHLRPNCQNTLTGNTFSWKLKYSQQERRILVSMRYPAVCLVGLDF